LNLYIKGGVSSLISALIIIISAALAIGVSYAYRLKTVFAVYPDFCFQRGERRATCIGIGGYYEKSKPTEIPQDCHVMMITAYQSRRRGIVVSCELQTDQSDLHSVHCAR